MSVPAVRTRVTLRSKRIFEFGWDAGSLGNGNSSHRATCRLLVWTRTLRYLSRCTTGNPHISTYWPSHVLWVSLIFKSCATSFAWEKYDCNMSASAYNELKKFSPHKTDPHGSKGYNVEIWRDSREFLLQVDFGALGEFQSRFLSEFAGYLRSF